MLKTWLFLAVYAVVFAGLAAGIFFWRRRTRKDRAPLPESTRLLRGPGETLRRQLLALDERTSLLFVLAFAAPVALGGLIGWIATHGSDGFPLATIAGLMILLLIALIFIGQLLARSIERWRNTYLGYYGERVVAEALDPLKAAGFRVLHDVPFPEARTFSNLDHVLVGPTGVFVIETKTRRKGLGRSRSVTQEIIYDGEVLTFPWGPDRHGLNQSAQLAKALETLVAERLGRPVPVRAILTFPGWTIDRRAPGPINVLNPREITPFVTAASAILTAEEITRVAEQLEARCRDVEF